MTNLAAGFRELRRNGRELVTDALWTHLGKLVLGDLAVSRTVSLPPGSITTGAIAAGAVNQRLGGFFSGTGWSSVGVNTWQETDVKVGPVGGFTGAEVRIEFGVTGYLDTAGGYAFVGIAIDGSPTWQVGIIQVQTANFNGVCAGTFYATPTAGTHSFSVVINPAVGKFTLRADTYQRLFVTEQKR